MDENQKSDDNMKNELPDDTAGLKMSGHILVRDKETGEEIVNKRNAIHYGNMAQIVAQALNNDSNARLYYMGFGLAI